jgi:O-antigen/teichoic acid export membrane protein
MSVMRRGRASSAGRTALLGVADQGVSSLTNFGFSIVAATSLAPSAFGAFAVVYLLYSIALAGAQAVIGQELVLTNESAGTRLARSRDALLFSMMLGLAVSCVLAAGALMTSTSRGPILCLCMLMPFLLLQDTLRHAASVVGKMEVALISDLVWLLVGAGSLVTLHARGFSMSALTFVAVWGTAGALAGLVCLPVFRSPHAGAPSLRRFRSRSYLGYRFVWEFVALRASSQFLVILLGVLAGLSAVGGFRGATTMFGPLSVMIMAASSFGVPIVRSVSEGRRETALLAMAGVLVGATVVLMVVLMVLPDSVGSRLLGDTWAGAMSYVPAVGAQTAFTSITTVVFMGLRMAAPRSTLRLRVVPAMLMPLSFAVGYVLAGPTGGAWGIAAASGSQAAIATVAYSRLRRRGLHMVSARVSSDQAVEAS